MSGEKKNKSLVVVYMHVINPDILRTIYQARIAIRSMNSITGYCTH